MTFCRVCKKMLPEGSYCEAHRGIEEKAKAQSLAHLSANYPGRRVGFYQSYAWKKLSKQILSERPVCERCKQSPSKEVHHTGYAEPLDPAGLVALCERCHTEFYGVYERRASK